MPTITERRRRHLRPAVPVEDLFEELESADEADREELLFERASIELETGRSRRGMYAKALTAADGDRNRAGARYMQLRVDQLAHEFEAWEADREEASQAEELRAAASADFIRTLLAIAALVVAIIAVVSWS